VSAASDKLRTDVRKILDTTWSIRSGQVVPKTEDVALENGAVKLDVAILYADLAHSTQLARKDKSVAAKVVRAYLSTMTRLVNDSGGTVRSFDGDRVMGIFIGGSKNSNAAKCALKMNYVVKEILVPQAKAKFTSLKDFNLTHCAGVSRSEVLVVRGGVRGSNDLVFVGSAPNIAAKLSEIRDGNYRSYIDWKVHQYLRDDAKYGGKDKKHMWIKTKRTIAGAEWELYRSSWQWTP
jgi:class 3 adenylate cyclase